MGEMTASNATAERNAASIAANVFSIAKIMLWINSGCNARCKSCDIWREKPGHSLTASQIRGWLPEWQELGLKTVVVCGEPLLHPKLWEIVAAIRDGGITVELLTNGFLLDRHATQVTQYIKELRVSLDGPEEIHNLMRGRRNAFEKLQDGIQAVRAIEPGFRIDGRCHIHHQNFRLMRETIKDAKRIGLSGLSFSGTDFSNAEAFRRADTINDEYSRLFNISGDALVELQQVLETLVEKHSDDFRSRFLTDSPEKLKHLILDYYRDLNGGARRHIKCNSPWTSAVIEYDGTVRPCFPMPAYGKIGDMGTLKQTLNSQCACESRVALDVTTNETCRRCVDQTLNLFSK